MSWKTARTTIRLFAYFLLVSFIYFSLAFTEGTIWNQSNAWAKSNDGPILLFMTPDETRNTKVLGVDILGFNFSEPLTLRLTQNWRVIEAEDVEVIDAGKISCIFDFVDVSPGRYDLEIETADGQFVLDKCMLVKGHGNTHGDDDTALDDDTVDDDATDDDIVDDDIVDDDIAPPLDDDIVDDDVVDDDAVDDDAADDDVAPPLDDDIVDDDVVDDDAADDDIAPTDDDAADDDVADDDITPPADDDVADDDISPADDDIADDDAADDDAADDDFISDADDDDEAEGSGGGCAC